MKKEIKWAPWKLVGLQLTRGLTEISINSQFGPANNIFLAKLTNTFTHILDTFNKLLITMCRTLNYNENDIVNTMKK